MNYVTMSQAEYNTCIDELKKIGTVAFGSGNKYPERFTVICYGCGEYFVYENINDVRTVVMKIIVRG